MCDGGCEYRFIDVSQCPLFCVPHKTIRFLIRVITTGGKFPQTMMNWPCSALDDSLVKLCRIVFLTNSLVECSAV